MPDAIRWYLSMKWLEPTRRLNDRLEGRLSRWVESMEQAVGSASSTWRLGRAFNLWVARRPEQVAFALYDRINEMRLARSWRRIGR